MKVSLIGSGYVGLVTGACFAEFGFEVNCVDQDSNKINNLNQGKIPIYEPGLDSLVQQGVNSNRLFFTTDIKSAVANSDVVMIAVGTPIRSEDGHADLSYVYNAAAQIARAINGYTVVVTKSTVPVGTCRKVAEIILENRPELKPGIDFDVASNPEFLREGSAINDFMRPDRVVLGTDSEKAKAYLQKLYRPLYLIETPIVHTQIETSELIKYAANGFLATKITFINQIADLCEKVGADVQDVARGIGLDGRIGRKFLHAGPGYGGSCFPKDTVALSKTARDFCAPISLIEAVIEANDQRKNAMAVKILQAISNKKSPKIAILGITFKPNTDDLRDAASLCIVPNLLGANAQITIYDPLFYTGSDRLSYIPENWQGVKWASNPYQAMEGADGVAILTEWNQFRALDWEKAKDLMAANPVVVDLRNIYKPEEMKELNLKYISVGRHNL